MGRKGEGAGGRGPAAVSLTQQGTAQDNRCLCSKNSWRCGCFPRRNPNLQRARGRQQHVGCQRSRTGTFWKAKQTRRQIGNVAARGPNEQVVKLHVLLKDTPGSGTGRAGLPGLLAWCPDPLQSQIRALPQGSPDHHGLVPPQPPRCAPLLSPPSLGGELLELLLIFLGLRGAQNEGPVLETVPSLCCLEGS